MRNPSRVLNAQMVVIALVVMITCGCDNGAARRAAVDKAQAQVRRIVADLDKRTTDTGVYIRVKEDEIKENDPWGSPIKVSYSQGGVAETVMARSAGPDGEFQTDDDIFAQGMAANLKGIGEGIKKNAEETAANTAKGVVKGTVDGVKESINDSLSYKKKKNADAELKAEKSEAVIQPDSDSK